MICGLLRDESGVNLIESGLIAGLISVAAITALTSVGISLRTMFDTVSGDLLTAVSSS